MNARNLLYIKALNSQQKINLADNKLSTKAFLSARSIPVPRLYKIISTGFEIQHLRIKELPGQFVVKPNRGLKGEGILIVDKNHPITEKDLKKHLQKILYGDYSIDGKSDTAFFEQKIINHSFLQEFSYQGLADIRIIVFNQVPVMAMLRLPSKVSHGKANLYQGAYGAGVNLANGTITNLIQGHHVISKLDGLASPVGKQIPFWDQVLEIASICQKSTEIGFLSVDIAIDKHQGPVLLEINARAGLGIQLANLQPLRQRLEKVADLKITSVDKALQIAKDLFSEQPKSRRLVKKNRPIISLYPIVKLQVGKTYQSINSHVSTQIKQSIISAEFIALHPEININSKKQINLKVKINQHKFFLKAHVRKFRNNRQFPLIIAAQELRGEFLIDPSPPESRVEKASSSFTFNHFIASDLQEIDQQIYQCSEGVKILYQLRPINYHSELNKAIAQPGYNPQFAYRQLPENYSDIVRKLQSIPQHDSKIGKALQDRIDEMLQQIALLKHLGNSDFKHYNEQLYLMPTELDLIYLKNLIGPKHPNNKSRITLNLSQIIDKFNNYLSEKKIRNWQIEVLPNLIATCVINKNRKILLRENLIISEARLQELIIHELDSHLLTTENAYAQPLKIFLYGFKNYLVTQEGLAVHNTLKYAKQKLPRRLYLLANACFLGNLYSFAEGARKLQQFGLNYNTAVRFMGRVKRGMGDTSTPGCFGKDFIYVRGLNLIENFLNQGGKIKDLYQGKISIEQLPLIRTLPAGNQSLVYPDWLI